MGDQEAEEKEGVEQTYSFIHHSFIHSSTQPWIIEPALRPLQKNHSDHGT